MIYLDSSAVVKLVHVEEETPALQSWLAARAGTPLVTSLVARIETERALRRSDPAALPHLPLVLGGINMILIGDSICAAAGAYPDPSLRSLDAIHLATAAFLGSTLTALVTYDERLSVAAVSHGMTVASPA
jgi:uncharacterized protein